MRLLTAGIWRGVQFAVLVAFIFFLWWLYQLVSRLTSQDVWGAASQGLGLVLMAVNFAVLVSAMNKEADVAPQPRVRPAGNRALQAPWALGETSPAIKRRDLNVTVVFLFFVMLLFAFGAWSAIDRGGDKAAVYVLVGVGATSTALGVGFLSRIVIAAIGKAITSRIKDSATETVPATT